MASRTIWQHLYDDPGDDDRWRRFRNHYAARVYTWAVKMLDGNRGAAEEVTENVFQSLYKTITNPEARRVATSHSSAGFVFRAVEHACADYHRQIDRQSRLTRIMWEKLKSTDARQHLETLITDAERAEELEEAGLIMAALAGRYLAAVRNYKARQRTLKERGQSWAVFLAAYSVEPYPQMGKHLDEQFNFPTRGYAFKAAHRVAQALFQDMELPFATGQEWSRSECILRELVKRHGDPPE